MTCGTMMLWHGGDMAYVRERKEFDKVGLCV